LRQYLHKKIKIIKQELWHGDCLELMKDIPDKTVDMILCDLPYPKNFSQGKYLGDINLKILWSFYDKIIKENGNIIFFGAQPFTSDLILSNRKDFKYELIWEKPQSNNPFIVKRQIRRHHENIIIFYKSAKSKFFPIMEKGKPYKAFSGKNISHNKIFNKMDSCHKENLGTRYPKSILKFATDRNRFHPTQKPLALCEYLIKTYTNEGDLVLDNCMGSGTTCLAAKNLNRQFIGIEKEKEYYDICVERLL